MKQFYATIFCSLLIVPCFAQQLPAAPAQQPDLQSLIPIQKGDSFYLRPTLPPGKNQTIVTNAIRAVGAGLATYGTAHAPSRRRRYSPVCPAAYPYHKASARLPSIYPI